MKAMKFSEEEYREAAYLWRKNHPKESSVKVRERIRISNGKNVALGLRVQYMRQHSKLLTEEQKEFWSSYGLVLHSLHVLPTEQEYREAASIWRKQYPEALRIPVKEKVVLSNGKEISLGAHFQHLRNHVDTLSEEDKNFWASYGLLLKKNPCVRCTDKEYREAASIWRSQNPNIPKIPSSTIVTISSGKTIFLGRRFSEMRLLPDTLSPEQKTFWTSYGLYAPKVGEAILEKEYQEAALLWRKQYPERTRIRVHEQVLLSSGRRVPLGFHIQNLKLGILPLTEEEKNFWVRLHLLSREAIPKEKDYQEAAKKYREVHPDCTILPIHATMSYASFKKLRLGKRLDYMNRHPQFLSEEQKEFWSSYGLFQKKSMFTEQEYREAARLWRKEHPEEEMISRSQVVSLPDGREVRLGIRMTTMREHLDTLDEEQKDFWKEYGLLKEKQQRTYYSEEEFREAALLWREQYPERKRILTSEKISISNGKNVPVGAHLFRLRKRKKMLSEEQREFWGPYGLNDFPVRERGVSIQGENQDSYLEAILSYLEKEGKKETDWNSLLDTLFGSSLTIEEKQLLQEKMTIYSTLSQSTLSSSPTENISSVKQKVKR